MPRNTILYHWHYLLRVSVALWGILLVALALSACVSEQTIQIGMTSTEVIQILGKPDQIVYQDGKVLVPVVNANDIDFANHRIVFIYDDNTRQVWFENGAVNSMSQHGTNVPLSTKNSH